MRYGLPACFTHSLRYGSDKSFGTAKFLTWRFSESIPVYSIIGLFPWRIVAEPDQQPLMSKGRSEKKKLRKRMNQLIYHEFIAIRFASGTISLSKHRDLVIILEEAIVHKLDKQEEQICQGNLHVNFCVSSWTII
ncbi:unnamed protein product [Lactuca virosa]|uniref:Uncharacterized protein n=1 Tax=Lactuca virosa TaxID=75947 RepID=A0AAU9PGA1_9ASTR|nr:unnamed protein product [Lactuca virosa]